MVIDSFESLTPARYLSLARRLHDESTAGKPTKLALLSSNSFSFLEPYLIVECARRGLAASMWVSPFGQIEQAIVDSSAGISSVDPDVVVIAMRVEDVFTDAFLRPGGAQLRERVYVCIDRLEQCVNSIREISDATVLVANFAVPHISSMAGIFDATDSNGPACVISEANTELADRVAGKAGILVWDFAGLTQSRGTESWTDERLWRLARQPISAVNLPHAASHLARSIAATVFQPAKCLVLDLDNTLWGGVAGDDGIRGIQVGDDYPGNVFSAFQSAVLGVKDRGVLLGIASKNDEAVIREIFDDHPELIVRWDDFASAEINWGPKSESIKNIAKELNIGLDSLVFFDDNPVEREEVRQHVPEVNVIDVPDSPLNFIDALFSSGQFDTPTRSSEDADRWRYYQNDVRREALRESVGSMETFLSGLKMELTAGKVGPETIARATQLIAKTNQFNLTTRRHSQSKLQRMVDSDYFEVFWTRLADRYGDSGIIGVTVVQYDGTEASIDSFLMSCRVMNRRVEQAMLVQVIERAVDRGCTAVRGQYMETDRNTIVSDFYAKFGFAEVESLGGERRFLLDLNGAATRPEWPTALRRQGTLN